MFCSDASILKGTTLSRDASTGSVRTRCDKGDERAERPGLRPAHVGGFYRRDMGLSEIESPSFFVVHILHRPLKNVSRKGVIRRFVGEEANSFRRGVNVDEIESVGVVFRGEVGEKKLLRVEFDAPSIGVGILLEEPEIQRASNRFEVEARMKRVDPALPLPFRVEPRSVGTLSF